MATIKTKRAFKAFMLCLSAFSVLSFTSCSDDEYDYQSDPNALLVDVTDEAIEPTEGISTRASYSGYHTDFTKGDAIGVYAYDGDGKIVNSNIKFVKQDDGSWTPYQRVEYDPSYTYYAYFPYNERAYTPASTAGDEDTKFANFITDQNNLFWKADQSKKDSYDASNLMIASGTLEGERTIKFTMKHKRALAIITDPVNKWYYSDNTNTKFDVTPAFDGNVPYNLDGKSYFLMKPDQYYTVGGLSVIASVGKYTVSSGMEILAEPTYTYSTSTDGGNTWSSYTSTKPSWLTISTVENGENPRVFSVTPASTLTTSLVLEDNTLKSASSVSNVDLSMVRNDGTARTSRTTANCYLVHSPGTYRIPLVYGNSILNGATNISAYHTDATGVMQNLVNHKDQAIYTGDDAKDPWIKNHGFSVDGAKLVWEDVKGLVKNASINGDYLTFEIDKDNIAEGNAVIAATSGGTIVWSWHIWCTRELLKTNEFTDIATGAHTYRVAPINVGAKRVHFAGSRCRVRATANSTSVQFEVKQPDFQASATGSEPYYQWGRKDPELPSTGGYDIDGNDIMETEVSNTTTNTIGTTIQNPLIHYYNSNTQGPYNTTHNNYWDMGQGGTGEIFGETVKTVYDPCPPDCAVPTSGLTEFIRAKGSDSNYGYWVGNRQGRMWRDNNTTVFFPASGSRSYSSGALFNVGSNGYYWSASARSGTNGMRLDFNSGYWDYSVYNDTRAYGCPVRPVLDY